MPLPLELAKRSGRKELVTLVQKYLEGGALSKQTKINEIEAGGAIYSATRLKTLGQFALLKSDHVVKGPAISLNSETFLRRETP